MIRYAAIALMACGLLVGCSNNHKADNTTVLFAAKVWADRIGELEDKVEGLEGRIRDLEEKLGQ